MLQEQLEAERVIRKEEVKRVERKNKKLHKKIEKIQKDRDRLI